MAITPSTKYTYDDYVLLPDDGRRKEIIDGGLYVIPSPVESKRKMYERYGVPEYWIVDPVVETIKVYRLEETAYRRVAELSNETGVVLTTPLLPDLRIALSDVFSAR